MAEPHAESRPEPSIQVREERIQEPVPAIIAERPAPAPAAAPVPAPEPQRERIEPKKLLEEAGLVMIETDRSKAPSQPVQEEPVHLGRPRRERPQQQPEDEELQQVETKR